MLLELFPPLKLQKWLKSNADRDDLSQKLVAIKTTRMNLKSKVERRDSDINYCDVSWHQRDKCKIYSVVFVVVHWRVRTLSFDWRAFFFLNIFNKASSISPIARKHWPLLLTLLWKKT